MQTKRITNFDRIKAMSVEEMAEMLEAISECGFDGERRCRNCPLQSAISCDEYGIEQWLESEAADNA